MESRAHVKVAAGAKRLKHREEKKYTCFIVESTDEDDRPAAANEQSTSRVRISTHELLIGIIQP
jgi:hypothetical protein